MRRLIHILCCVCLLGQQAAAYAEPMPEYAVKAAFLYNFALFTEWPSPPGDNLHMCVLGKDPFGPVLEEVAGRQVNGMRLNISRLADISQLKSCHILYFGESERASTRKILEALGGAPVLTVTDAEGLVQAGVMIGMQVSNSRLVFEVNVDAARRANLVLSSKLLRLARKVHTSSGGGSGS